MELVKLEPRRKEEDKSTDKALEEINKIDWESLFAFGFTKEGELFYIHSAGSVYEFLGMMTIVKKVFIDSNED